MSGEKSRICYSSKAIIFSYCVLDYLLISTNRQLAKDCARRSKMTSCHFGEWRWVPTLLKVYSHGLSSRPPKGEWGKKDPGSGWSRALVTNLSSWEGLQLFRILTPLVFVTSKADFASLWQPWKAFLRFRSEALWYLLHCLQRLKLSLQTVKIW